MLPIHKCRHCLKPNLSATSQHRCLCWLVREGMGKGYFAQDCLASAWWHDVGWQIMQAAGPLYGNHLGEEDRA